MNQLATQNSLPSNGLSKIPDEITLPSKILSKVPIITPQTNASTDEDFLNVWLANRPNTTARTYRTAARQFLSFVGKPIRAIVLEDLQQWCTELTNKYKSTTVKNKVNSIKSMLSFALKVGYTQINIGAAIKAKKPWEELSKRIISKDEIRKLIAAGKTSRDRLIMECLYIMGLRISELHQLEWPDLRAKDDGSAIATIKGKGCKTRFVNLPKPLYEKLLQQKGSTTWLFSNYKGERLSLRSINYIIKEAALKAGITEKVSAHWFRHAHASHSLDAGCDLNLLKETLGHSSLAITSVYLHANPDRSSSQFLSV